MGTSPWTRQTAERLVEQPSSRSYTHWTVVTLEVVNVERDADSSMTDSSLRTAGFSHRTVCTHVGAPAGGWGLSLPQLGRLSRMLIQGVP